MLSDYSLLINDLNSDCIKHLFKQHILEQQLVDLDPLEAMRYSLLVQH